MRKFSKLALLLSLMLGASFCLSACNDEPTGKSDDSSSSYSSYDEDEGKTPEQLEQEANESYAERIAKWTQYVEYAAPEKQEAMKYTQLTEKDTFTTSSIVNVNDAEDAINKDLYQVISTKEVYKDVEVTPAEIDENTQAIITPAEFKNLKTATESSYKLYNATTGALVLERNDVDYVEVGGKLLDTTKKKSDEVQRIILTNVFNGLVVVGERTYELREAEEPAEGEDPEVVDATLVSNYNEKVTYAVYDQHGNELLKNLTTEDMQAMDIQYAAEQDEWKTQAFVSIADKTFAMLDGEIIKTFARGTQYDIPQYTEEVEHSYFTYGNYGYYVIESDPEVMQIGDFYMARVPGVSIEVTNANKELAWKYDTTSYHVAGYSVLSDGDVYICEYKMLEAGATQFDIESAGIKFDVIHSRIDVETGAVTSMEKDFIAQKVYNNVTPKIQTLLNIAATSEVLANCKVKDGYMLAQVQKYAGGVLDSNTEIAVLDEEMNIVATLPKIIENQFGYVGFLDKDTMLVNTITTSSKSICYTADTKTGDLELYFRSEMHSYLDYIEGGFVYNDKVYDYDWNVRYDLSYENEEYDDIYSRVVGDAVYIEAVKYVTTDEGEERQTTIMIGYFTDEYHGTPEFTTKTITTYKAWYSNVNDGDKYKYDFEIYMIRRNETYVNKVEIYDNYGNLIMEIDTSDDSSYDGYYMDENHNNYNSVNYDITKNVTVNEINDTGTYLVCVSETWSLNSYNYYPDEAHNKSGTYYQYYILK